MASFKMSRVSRAWSSCVQLTNCKPVFLKSIGRRQLALLPVCMPNAAPDPPVSFRAELFPKRLFPGRREADDPGSLGTSRPAVLEAAIQQRRPQRTREMMAPGAPVETCPAQVATTQRQRL